MAPSFRILLTLWTVALASYGKTTQKRRLIYSYDGSDRHVNWTRFSEVYPYVVSVQWGGQHSCGGTLINSRWVLSAGHCFYTSSAQVPNYEVWSVVAGQEEFTKSKIDLVVVHPEYHMITLNDDLALLRLSEPLPNGPFATLETSESRHDGSQALLAGWGSIDEACEKYEFLLKEGDTEIVGHAPCAENGAFFNWTERICTEHINATGTDMAGAGCGDSGGPLFVTDSDQLVQIGVVSYTAAGRDVFTRVFTYLDWINGVINSPPADHQMVAPLCYGSCCDDPDYTDEWQEECWTWQGLDCRTDQLDRTALAELAQKCVASCGFCPICEATNSNCCDDSTYISGQGHKCSQWQGFDCATASSDYAYSSTEQDSLISTCPFSCGLCSTGSDCADTAYFMDQYGYTCAEWDGLDCSQAKEVYNYEQHVEDMVLKHCPLTCRVCTPPETTATTTAQSEVTTTAETTTAETQAATTTMIDASLSSSISKCTTASILLAFFVLTTSW